jgi:hypothetical protein
MPGPPVEVADVIRAAGESFYKQSQQWFTWLHLKVLNAILRCRTAALGGHVDTPVLRGTAFVRNPRNATLWTRGWTPRLGTYPGLEVPNPLSVEVCRGQSSIETVLNDIMALTKLNYNACLFADGSPITLKFANAVGEVLTAGLIPSGGAPLPFMYYI